MAILPQRADVRELLARLRPGSEFGWKGGPKNDTAQVRYRDPATTEPTEAEYLAELALVDAENTTRAASRAAERARVLPAVGQTVTALTNAEFRAVVERLLSREGALDRQSRIRPLNRWEV